MNLCGLQTKMSNINIPNDNHIWKFLIHGFNLVHKTYRLYGSGSPENFYLDFHLPWPAIYGLGNSTSGKWDPFENHSKNPKFLNF
jgi:hypothetical protein